MKRLFACFCLMASTMGYAHDNPELEVNVNSPSFEVTLPANSTTGFQWSILHYDKGLLTLSGSSYEQPKTKLMGAGGKMHFIFTLQKRANYPVSTDILFKYEHSWEPSTATIKNVKVNFVTTAPKKATAKP